MEDNAQFPGWGNEVARGAVYSDGKHWMSRPENENEESSFGNVETIQPVAASMGLELRRKIRMEKYGHGSHLRFDK